MPLPLRYNWRNLFVRKLSTALTFTLVAVVVFVLSVLLAFAEGIRASLKSSGSPQNIIVLKPGATSESTSLITPEEAARLDQTPGIVLDPAGRPLISQELYVQTSIPRRGPSGALANVAVRGVDDQAFVVHDQVRLLDDGRSRRFRQGAMEVIVGKAAMDRYADLQIGGEVSLGRLSNRAYRVVGVFEANGSALESEIWTPRTMLHDSYFRRPISSAVLRTTDPSVIPAAIDYINGPAVNLEARLETAYYQELSSKTRDIVYLTSILVGIMAVGAAFAVANTMYAAVDGRRREIAMLKTIGFSRQAIMLAFVIESLLICLTACLFGLGMSLFVNGIRQDFLSETTWTVLAYELKVTPITGLVALALAGFVGLVGAMAPALRAARTGTIEALRKA